MWVKGAEDMKCTVIIGDREPEEIIVYAKERTPLVEEIEALAAETSDTLYGYRDRTVNLLDPKDVYCFVVESNRIFARTDEGNFLIKARIYQLEESLGKDFIKINQSCIANIRKIKKFDASIAGALKVVFTNGSEDYVSRRNIKFIKERLGI